MAALLALVTVTTTAAQEIPKQIKPTEEIRGKFVDDKDLPKMKAAPANPITDEKEFAKLWKEWKGDEALPKIDFKKQFAMTGTTICAANRIFGGFTLSKEGDLKSTFGSTLIGGPGFAWVIYVLDREGVKTVGGKALP
jgi:hypothetical protein